MPPRTADTGIPTGEMSHRAHTLADANRGVAQLGSALALGARGRGFKSRHPDSRAGIQVLPPTLVQAQISKITEEYACEEQHRDAEPDPGTARHRGAVRRARAEPQEGVPGD